MHHRPSRAAFTLFEVAISLGLVAFGVISVLMLLPSGIQAQQMARYQVIAAAKALELVESYNTTHNGNPAIDVEADQPWNVHVTAKNMHPDLESRVASYRYGMFPLPLEITRRIDSDGDEIQRVIAEGGYLYYSQPLATTGFQENGFPPTTPPNEAQRLVMAVVGYPQNNMLWALPQKAWPYYTPYPSPPVHVITRAGLGTAGADIRNATGEPTERWKAMLWEDINLGPETAGLRAVYDAYYRYTVTRPGERLFDAMGVPNTELIGLAKAYGEAAVAWCVSTGLPAVCYDGSTLLTDFPSSDRRHLQTIAARVMGHVGPIMLAAQQANAGTVTFDATTVANMHENALVLGMKFAASYPYDWGAPRPLQRAIMMDFPLIEYDLMVHPRNPQPGLYNTITDPTLFRGAIFGTTPGIMAYQWHPVTPHPVVNAGRSFTYPFYPTATNGVDWAKLWGPTQHSTLTQAFRAAERCRQLVFWAVDWQSYEDFETAPSAPVDAGRYMKYAPASGRSLTNLCNNSVNGVRWMDHHMFGYRNPEKMIAFNSDMNGIETGRSTPYGKSTPGTHGPDNFGGNTNDQGLTMDNMSRFIGRWGADRNANRQLDRGVVPKSVRMRAVTVARFNYYDLRVPATLR
jgi:hypothetical protein